MYYRVRIQIAATLSLLLHLALLAYLLPHLLSEPPVPLIAEARERPIVLTLNKPFETEGVRRLIESGAPSENPVADTDLISDMDTQAQDDSGLKGETNQPRVDEVDDFDELGTPPIPPPGEIAETKEIDTSEAESQAEQRAKEPTAAAESVDETRPRAADVSAEIPDTDAIDAVQTITLLTESTDEPASPSAALDFDIIEPEPEPTAPANEGETDSSEEAEEVPERFEVAQAAGVPSVEAQELRIARGREFGGTDRSGFTSFEANKHEMGEYMLKIRRAVERHWRAGLQLRYSGVTRTYALIECSIRPDGTVEYARILESGGSMSYSILCREAILRAAPFGPFPFDVPDIYRKENLEIVWKFSFL